MGDAADARSAPEARRPRAARGSPADRLPRSRDVARPRPDRALLDRGVLSRSLRRRTPCTERPPSAPPFSRPRGSSPRRRPSSPLPGLEVGAVVETLVRIRERLPFPGGARYFCPLGAAEPARRYRVIAEAPATLPLAFKVHGRDPVEPKEEIVGALKVRTWDVYEPAAAPEADPGPLPPDVRVTSALEITTGTSWKNVAATYRAVVEKRLVGVAVEVPAGLPSDPVAKIQALVRDVQKDVRYASLAFGESDIVLAPPDQVRTRRFGDCKDQATLLVALLRASGFDAAVALLVAGRGFDVSADRPALAGFTHAIVHVRKPEMWIDPTSTFSRAGELPEGDLGRWALVCREGVSSLVRTPRNAAASNRQHMTVDVKLADEGRCDLVETTTFFGAPYEVSMRDSLDGAGPKYRERLEKYVKDALGDAALDGFSHSEPRDLSKPMRLEIRARGSRLGETGETSAEVPIYRRLATTLFPRIAEKRRRVDLAVTPFTHEAIVRVVPPPGFRVVAMPEAEERAIGPASMRMSASIDGAGAVVVAFRVVFDRDRLSPDEALTLRAALERVNSEGPLVVRCVHQADVELEEGRVAEAFSRLRSEIEASPERASAHRRLSRALLSVGLGDAARREARLATTLAPQSPAAHRTLGRALTHDSLGRPFRPGWDPDGADRAFAAAEELDPKNVREMVDRANALEFDASGARFEDRARLDAAIAHYERILEAKPPLRTSAEAFARTYTTALLFRGRAADASKSCRPISDRRLPSTGSSWRPRWRKARRGPSRRRAGGSPPRAGARSSRRPRKRSYA